MNLNKTLDRRNFILGLGAAAGAAVLVVVIILLILFLPGKAQKGRKE